MMKVGSFCADLSRGSGPVFEVRRALNISQSEMAHLMGYRSQSSISCYERRNCRLPSVKRRRLIHMAQRYATPDASPYVLALAKGQKVLEF